MKLTGQVNTTLINVTISSAFTTLLYLLIVSNCLFRVVYVTVNDYVSYT